MTAPRSAQDFAYREAVQQQVSRLLRSELYHSLQLPDGTVIPGLISIEALENRIKAFPIPRALHGRRVLDVGAASGWNSFEMCRRGASVTAVDCVEFQEFIAAREFFSEGIDYKILDVDELSIDTVGKFDYVLLFGVLYHLRHPLLGLEKICSITKETAFVESFVTDPPGEQTEGCSLEFYESDELGGQIDNWFGPTVKCLLALCRSAGFARVSLEYVSDRRAGVTCHRCWEAEPESSDISPVWLLSAVNNRTGDIYFHPLKDEYVCIYFRTSAKDLTPGRMRIEVDGFGTNALTVTPRQNGEWQTNCRLPPGTLPGDHVIRLRTEGTRFGNHFVVTVLDHSARKTDAIVAVAPRKLAEELEGAPSIFSIENSLDRSTTFRGFSSERICCRFTSEVKDLSRGIVFACVDGVTSIETVFLTDLANAQWQATLVLPANLAEGVHSIRIRIAEGAWSDPAEFTFAGKAYPGVDQHRW